jgi:hypothetical protein
LPLRVESQHTPPSHASQVGAPLLATSPDSFSATRDTSLTVNWQHRRCGGAAIDLAAAPATSLSPQFSLTLVGLDGFPLVPEFLAGALDHDSAEWTSPRANLTKVEMRTAWLRAIYALDDVAAVAGDAMLDGLLCGGQGPGGGMMVEAHARCGLHSELLGVSLQFDRWHYTNETFAASLDRWILAANNYYQQCFAPLRMVLRERGAFLEAALQSLCEPIAMCRGSGSGA